MNNELLKELQAMNIAQLRDKLDDLQRELFQLKLNAVNSHIKDGSQFKKLKKNIARTLTIINQKNSGKVN